MAHIAHAVELGARYGTFGVNGTPYRIVVASVTEVGLFQTIEGQVRSGVEWLRLFVEALGALVIAAGVLIAVVGLVRHLIAERGAGFTPIRLAFARYLTLALELQLAADVLSTSVAPTWDRIGKLAAIAVIRTGLNYFLNKELQEERFTKERSTNERLTKERLTKERLTKEDAR